MAFDPLPAFLLLEDRPWLAPPRERVIEVKRQLLKVYLDDDLDFMTKVLTSSECYTTITENVSSLQDKAAVRDRFFQIRNGPVNTGDELLQDTLMQMVERLDTLL